MDLINILRMKKKDKQSIDATSALFREQGYIHVVVNNEFTWTYITIRDIIAVIILMLPLSWPLASPKIS